MTETATHEIVGVKKSQNGNFTIIIAININDRRVTQFTVYNNITGAKKVQNRSTKKIIILFHFFC